MKKDVYAFVILIALSTLSLITGGLVGSTVLINVSQSIMRVIDTPFPPNGRLVLGVLLIIGGSVSIVQTLKYIMRLRKIESENNFYAYTRSWKLSIKITFGMFYMGLAAGACYAGVLIIAITMLF